MTDFNPAEDEELVARIAALWMEANPGEFTDHEDAEYFARAELESGLPGIDNRDALAEIARHFYEKGRREALLDRPARTDAKGQPEPMQKGEPPGTRPEREERDV